MSPQSCFVDAERIHKTAILGQYCIPPVIMTSALIDAERYKYAFNRAAKARVDVLPYQAHNEPEPYEARLLLLQAYEDVLLSASGRTRLTSLEKLYSLLASHEHAVAIMKGM